MSLLTKALATAAAGAMGLTLLGVGGYVANERAAESLSAVMAGCAAQLLPGGAVEHVDVTDSPKLLAANRPTVQQTVVQGRTGDGHPVTMIVREYDRDTGRAESVSWQVEGLPLAPGWNGVRDERGVRLNAAEREVEGHRARVSASAALEAAEVAVGVEDLTVDGAPTALAKAPAAMREGLAPLTFAVPVPDPRQAVRSVWFDERGVGVELYAQNVDLGR